MGSAANAFGVGDDALAHGRQRAAGDLRGCVGQRRLHARDTLAPIGRITSVGPIEAENRLRGTFPLVGERGTVNVKFTLTPEREPKVQEIELTPVKQ